MKKIIILLCAVLLLCTACGVKKDETVPDNVPTVSDRRNKCHGRKQSFRDLFRQPQRYR